MSNGTTLAIALGLGGGALAWHLSRDKRALSPGEPVVNPPATAAAPVGAAPRSFGEPPRVAGPCVLKLDAGGLTIDGARSDVSVAVARCKANGRAELALASDAPAAIHAQLTSALFAAGVPFTMKVV
jgi:hypothetical protein